MLGLTLLVASIALADSINPSTVIPALWLASAAGAHRLASYTLGVFVVSLVGGLVLVFGPGRLLIASLHRAQGPLEHVVEAVGGVLALVFALAVWRSRRSGLDKPRARRTQTRASAFALGAGIMLVELPTAFIYFGAISAILAARRSALLEVALLVLYNAVFVAPLLAILMVRHFAGDRADDWIASAEARVRYVGRLALSGVAGAAGAALLTVGVYGLVST